MKIIHFILYIIKTFLIIFIGLIYLIVATIATFTTQIKLTVITMILAIFVILQSPPPKTVMTTAFQMNVKMIAMKMAFQTNVIF